MGRRYLAFSKMQYPLIYSPGGQKNRREDTGDQVGGKSYRNSELIQPSPFYFEKELSIWRWDSWKNLPAEQQRTLSPYPTRLKKRSHIGPGIRTSGKVFKWGAGLAITHLLFY